MKRNFELIDSKTTSQIWTTWRATVCSMIRKPADVDLQCHSLPQSERWCHCFQFQNEATANMATSKMDEPLMSVEEGGFGKSRAKLNWVPAHHIHGTGSGWMTYLELNTEGRSHSQSCRSALQWAPPYVLGCFSKFSTFLLFNMFVRGKNFDPLSSLLNLWFHLQLLWLTTQEFRLICTWKLPTSGWFCPTSCPRTFSKATGAAKSSLCAGSSAPKEKFSASYKPKASHTIYDRKPVSFLPILSFL